MGWEWTRSTPPPAPNAASNGIARAWQVERPSAHGHGLCLGIVLTPLLYLPRPPGRAGLWLTLCRMRTVAAPAECLLCAGHGAQSSTSAFPTIPHRSHSDFTDEETEAREMRVTCPKSHTKPQSRGLNQVCQPSRFATLGGCSLIC